MFNIKQISEEIIMHSKDINSVEISIIDKLFNALKIISKYIKLSVKK